MSFFAWSTPERLKGSQPLPVIPNEIYLRIFEHVAPTTGRLTQEELAALIDLSLVCRFFASSCLPRVFEVVEFSGYIFDRDAHMVRLRNEAIRQTTRGAALCTQVAAGQPLALSLVKHAKACHFSRFLHLKSEMEKGSSAVRLFINKCLTGMLYMCNLRELEFSFYLVDMEHWRVFAALTSLEELTFHYCDFFHGPADVELEKRVKIKVFGLRVTSCKGLRQLIAGINPLTLRTLTAESMLVEQADWLPQSAVTKFYCDWTPFNSIERVPVSFVLTQAPRSIEIFHLRFGQFSLVPREDGTIPAIFNDPAWKSLPCLRSLTLQLYSLAQIHNTSKHVFSSALGISRHLTNLQSLSLQDFMFPKMSPSEIQDILHREIDPTSYLVHVRIDKEVFRLVDGKWVKSVL